jgi:hypothetical protein
MGVLMPVNERRRGEPDSFFVEITSKQAQRERMETL